MICDYEHVKYRKRRQYGSHYRQSSTAQRRQSSFNQAAKQAWTTAQLRREGKRYSSILEVQHGRNRTRLIIYHTRMSSAAHGNRKGESDGDRVFQEVCTARKAPVKVCPSCGRRPEYPPITEGSAHIWTMHCEKCQFRFVIHVVR